MSADNTGPFMERRYWPTPKGYAALQAATPHTPPPEREEDS